VAAYCAETDLLLGDVPTSDSALPNKYVIDAADEIDSRIGHIYETPVDTSGTSTTARHARLLLKRINVWLATGRLLMAIDVSGEETGVHAYANKLVNDASAALDMIAQGELVLDGATRVAGFADSGAARPVYGNVDPESAVEAFYNRIANPDYYYVPPGAWNPWYR
jgi:hypothetical protein